MTYRELLEKASRDFQHNNISRRQYLEMTKPLDEEIRKTGKWLSAEEYALKIGEEVNETIKNSLYKFCSYCGQTVFGKRNYCPNCGADMRGA